MACEPPPPTMTWWWLNGLAAATLAMLCAWARQLRSRDATSVDAVWAIAIGLLGLAFAARGPGAAWPRSLAALLALAWSARLGTHLLRDRVLGHRGEDGRYRALRGWLGERAERKMVWVYLAQALLAAVFAVPFLALAHDADERVRPLHVAGLAVFAGGIALARAADAQLAAHRADPAQRGRTCRRGLWRASRHPNYLGEWLAWCGIAMCAAHSPGAPFALAVPVLLYVLMRWVTGVPFAEQQALRSRGDDYRDYMATTPVFFPWPRRRRPAVTP